MSIKSTSGRIGSFLFVLLMLFSWREAEGTAVKILDNGSTATHIDLLFIGSGFTSAELDAYRTYVSSNMTKLRSVNWFNTNQTKLNAWRIDATSSQSGVDLDDNTIYSLASEVAYDILIVIHNSLGQETAGKSYIELFKDSHNFVVLAHELGHTIGGLGDEYYGAGTCTGLSKMLPNVHDKNSNEKWSGLIATPPYEGARYCPTGLWRPSFNSIMYDSANTTTFDAVGLKAMDLAAGKLLGAIESTPPSLTVSGVSNNDTKAGTFTATANTSDSSGIERVEFYWARAGQTSKSIKITRTPLYNVTIDTTLYTDGQYYLDVLSYDTNWNYSRKTISFNIANSTLSIPLRLTETAGVARSQDLVSSGVPLKMGTATDASVLAVYNPAGTTVPAQFKILERWNGYGQDNSIKWLLVTFLADASASSTATYSLKYGSNPAPASPATAVDNGAYYTMSGQNFYKDFRVGSPFDITLKRADDTVYHAYDLSPITWTMEETGPIRTCIKAESLTEIGKFGFIAWIYGIAGQSRVDVKLVLKNTPKRASTPTQGQPFYFKDFAISWPRTGSAYTFGGDASTVYSGSLSSGDNLYIYQDSTGTSRWDKLSEHVNLDGYGAYVPNWGAGQIGWGGRIDFWKDGLPAFRGFHLVKNGSIIQSGNQAAGFASLAGSYVLLRDFWQQHPNSIEVTETKITAHLLSEHWAGHGGIHWLDDLSRKSWDLSFRTSGSSTDIAAFNAPLIIYCGLAWNKLAHPIGYISTRYAEMTSPNPANMSQEVNGWEYTWVNYGGQFRDRERRRYHHFFMNPFIRTGDPYCAREIILAMKHTSGMTPMYVDNYTYPGDAGILHPSTYTSPARNQGTYTSHSEPHDYMALNPEHSQIFDLLDGYRLTGDPIALDAIKNIATYWQFYIDYRKTHGIVETRQDADPLRNLCQAYRLTENVPIFNSINDYIDNVQWPKINKTYGYYALQTYWNAVVNYNNPSGTSVFENSMMISKLVDALIDAYEITHNQHAYDMIIRLTNFVINYGYSNKTAWFQIPVDASNFPGADWAVVAAWENAQSPGNGNAQYMVNGVSRGYGTYNMNQFSRPLAWCFLNSLETNPSKYKTVFDGLVSGAIATNYFGLTGTSARADQWVTDWGALPDYVYEVGGKSSMPKAPSGLAIIKK